MYTNKYKKRQAGNRAKAPPTRAEPPVSREHIREQKIDISKRANRHILQRVPTKNVHAKAWWKFAILCVVKDNRQISHGKFNEYVVAKPHRADYEFIITYFLGKLIDQNEDLGPESQRGKKKKSTAQVQGDSLRKDKDKKDKNAPAEFIFDLNAALNSLDECDRHLFMHALQATRVRDFDNWVKEVTDKRILQDELRRVRLRLQRDAAKEKQKLNKERPSALAKSSEGPSRDSDPAASRIQPAVRKTYGASILSYMSYWGGGSKTTQSAMEQQEEAERAVEAAALAEQERVKQMGESMLNEPMETDAETELETDGEYGDNDGLFDKA